MRMFFPVFAAAFLFAGPALAQETTETGDCEPTNLAEAFGFDDIEGCEDTASEDVSDEGVSEEEGVEGADEEEVVEGNPVAAAAKEPGSNRAAALAHANERSNGAVERAHSHRRDRGEDEDQDEQDDGSGTDEDDDSDAGPATSADADDDAERGSARQHSERGNGAREDRAQRDDDDRAERSNGRDRQERGNSGRGRSSDNPGRGRR